MLPSNSVEPVDLLNTAAEFQCLVDAGKDITKERTRSLGGPKLLLQPLTASVKSLRKLLTQSGGAILHFAGHGMSDGSLLFENNEINGMAHSVNYHNLGSLFKAGPKDEPTLLAFVSTCHSEQSGHAFVKSGVPHVVATNGRVRDDHAAHFTYQFYLALFSGKSVGVSFKIADESLRADIVENPSVYPPPDRSVLTASSQEKYSNSATPFLLLGNGRHDKTCLFPPGGPSSYCTVKHPASTLHNVPPGCGPGEFVGREVDALHILRQFAEHPRPRLLSLVGRQGVGKTTLAVKVCRYSAKRCAHWKQIRWVDGESVLREWEGAHANIPNSSSTAPPRRIRNWKSVSSLYVGGGGNMRNISTERGKVTPRLVAAIAKNLDLHSESSPWDISTPEELVNAIAEKRLTGEYPILIVFDALDVLLNHPPLQIATIPLLNLLLKCEDISLLVTSERSISDTMQASKLYSNIEVIPLSLQVKERIIVLPPLDDNLTKIMLTKCITSRKLFIAEIGIECNDYRCDTKLEMAVTRALGENQWVKLTQGLPGKIAELGKLLEKKRLDKITPADMQHLIGKGLEKTRPHELSTNDVHNFEGLESNTMGNATKQNETNEKIHERTLIRIKYQRVMKDPNGMVLHEVSNTERVRFSAFYREGSSKVDLDDEWKPLSAQNWLELLSSENENSKNLAIELSETIKKAVPLYDAFYFETKGISSSNASEKQFEFVLVNSPMLFKFAEDHPDPNTFWFLNRLPSETGVYSFPNLSHDTTLVSPRKKGSLDDKIYSHLASFLRGADNDQIAELWNLSADEMLRILHKFPEKSVWFSTHGTGIAWLTMRLSFKPKYYSYYEFRFEK